MEVIRFFCQQCGKPMKVDAKFAGKSGKCPVCKTISTVPATTAPMAATAPVTIASQPPPLLSTLPPQVPSVVARILSTTQRRIVVGLVGIAVVGLGATFILLGGSSHYLPAIMTDTSIEGSGSSAISLESYNKIQPGWTMAQVRALLGAPDSESVSTIPNFGTTTLWHYQKNSLGFSGANIVAITLFFQDGIVSNKTWTKI